MQKYGPLEKNSMPHLPGLKMSPPPWDEKRLRTLKAAQVARQPQLYS